MAEQDVDRIIAEAQRYGDAQIRLCRRRKAGPWEVCE